MNKVYLFTLAGNKDCDSLQKELDRVEGGLPIALVDFLDEGLQPCKLAKHFRIHGVPTLVKVNEHGTVTEALAGYKYTRETFERFLEVGV
jgi:hypothetical protein